PHTGTRTQINVRGHYVFPLVTGTFGMVDFFHSILGEATDHFTQSEINEMDNALGSAQASGGPSGPMNALTSLLSKVPGTRDLISEAEELNRRSDAQAEYNRQHDGSGYGASRSAPADGGHQGYGQSGDFY